MRRFAAMSRGPRLAILTSLLALVGYLAWAVGEGADGPAPSLATIRARGEALRPLQRIMPPAEEGEWLAEHREAGQSFDDYRASEPNRPEDRRTTLYLQPIGEFARPRRRLLDLTGEFLGIFYNVPVRRLPPIALDVLPASAHRVHPRWGGEQVDTLAILDELRKRVPEDAVAVLALTASDLWPNEVGRSWNFVFGQASLTDRVGVWSIARLGDPDRDFPLVLRRTLKVATHETGHLLGMWHCVEFVCGMNGSNNLSESDRRPLPFCSECEMKVWWSCRPAIRDRYRRLAAFAERNGLGEAARFWRESGAR